MAYSVILPKQIQQYVEYFINSETSLTHGILMHGPSGTGKSSVGTMLSNVSDVHFIKVTASELFYKCHIQDENVLKYVFKEAYDQAPSIIFLDDLDLMCEMFQSLEGDQAGILAELIDESQVSDRKILLLAAARHPSSIDEFLRYPGRLDIDVEFAIPDASERKEILKKILHDKIHNMNDEQISTCAESAHGCTGFDLYKICTEAEFIAFHNSGNCYATIEEKNSNTIIKYNDLMYQLKQVIPEALKNDQLNVERVQWDDIAGMDDVKDKLKDLVELPLKYPDMFEKLAITPAHGILLYGPPGCSKTMIAKALATESDMNFISVKGSELFSKWFGESEKAVRELFARAKKAAPCIIFLDEVDGLVAERGSSDGSGVNKRVIDQFLTELDGAEKLQGVFIIAATNRFDMLDDALLRPGRLDHLLYIPLPDADTRRKIFQLKIKNMPTDNKIDIEHLVMKTNGYSGAEVVAVCHQAQLLALSEDFPGIIENPVVTMKNFELAFQRSLPRPKEEGLFEVF